MRLGHLVLYPVSAGTYWKDGGGLFGLVPKVLWEKVATADDRNRLQFELNCLLIETAEQRILVDTGFGDKLTGKQRDLIEMEGEGRLLTNLNFLGIGPDDVDVVINTHLHSSICGGNTRRDENGKPVPTFPQASYYVQRLELADASFPNERTRTTYLGESFRPLEETGQLCTLWGDTRLTDEVRVVVTPGHTRAHQSVVIESQDQKALFLGSAALWPIHIERLSWVPAFDVEPLVSIETKRNLARWAVHHHALLIFEHHTKIQAGYLQPTERPDRFRLEPVSMEA